LLGVEGDDDAAFREKNEARAIEKAAGWMVAARARDVLVVAHSGSIAFVAGDDEGRGEGRGGGVDAGNKPKTWPPLLSGESVFDLNCSLRVFECCQCWTSGVRRAR
jgi:hypothetical protein